MVISRYSVLVLLTPEIILVGDVGCGKTCILTRLVDGFFREDYISTIGIDFRIKLYEIEGKKVKLQVWDTAGQERFRSITASYYRGSNAVVIIYDVTDHDSYENVRNWVDEVKAHTNPDTLLFLVGNKTDSDAERRVSNEDGERLADDLSIQFKEVSAKTNCGIDELFCQITNDLLKLEPKAMTIQHNPYEQPQQRENCGC